MTSPAGSDRCRGAAGFSLVELLAVAAIMGLLAGVAAVSLRGLRTPALSSAANEVASALKSTRQMAIASGRNMYLVIPVRSNALTGNPYRTYAIFEEVKPQQEMRTPDENGDYPINTSGSSWFIPRTDWRVLPEGAVFSSLAHSKYSPSQGDGFANLALGVLQVRNTADASPEWQNFSLFTNRISIHRPLRPTDPPVDLDDIPYLCFTPSGLAWLDGEECAGLTILPGFTKNGEVAVTDTNSFFVIEADSRVGRIRVRTPESYR